MQWNKRYWNIVLKLNFRRAKRNPHLVLALIMGQLTLLVAIGAMTQAYFGKSRFAESTFTHWKKVQKQQRSIASVTDSCEFDEITVQRIQQEIATLEAQYQTGHNIQGNWKGIELQSLPSIQAQFIADNGHLIGDQNKSYNLKNCSDVICVLNAIYLDSSKLSGHLSYYWYLKTGSMLSMSNIIPGQRSQHPGEYDGKVHNHRDYLFSKVELISFYKLAKSLPSNFLHNPLLKSIHKIPNNGPVVELTDAPNNCALSFPTGQILINNNCMDNYQGKNAFYINVANQMAKYLDRQIGNDQKTTSVSSGKDWPQLGFWQKEEYWNNMTHDYQYQWSAHLKSQNLIGLQALSSPSEYLTRVIANYRFAPETLMQQTPPEITNFVAKNFFHLNAYSDQGLYEQYLNESFDLWSQKEQILWGDCIQDHLKPEALGNGTRNLASDLEDPLFSCVERKVPLFIEDIVSTIKKENFEGCDFFSNTDHQFYSQKFHESLDKLIRERILLRKIEMKKFGEDVLIGQIVKNEFIQKIDPVSVFVNCFKFQNGDREKCYTKTLDAEIKVLLQEYEINNEYASNIKSDIGNIFNYDRIHKQTNEVGKQFIAPYYSKVKFQARELWEQCKADGPGNLTSIKLPMQFSGRKHYVNAKFLNCINEGIEDSLEEVVNVKAFQKVQDQDIQFALNTSEKQFALSFLRPKFLQVLNNLLDEQVNYEQSYLSDYFTKNQNVFLNKLGESTEDFLAKVYSAEHLDQLCLDKVKEHYPENYFFQTKKEISNKYGRTICSQYAKQTEINTATTKLFNKRWQEHMEFTKEIFLTGFKEKTFECYNDYPVTGRRDPQTEQMRITCIEGAFQQSIYETIQEWQDSENVTYFKNRKKELFSRFTNSKQQFIQLALNHEL